MVSFLKSIHTLALLVIIWAHLVQSKNSYKWTVSRFPNPQTAAAPICNQIQDNTHICDPDKILLLKEIDTLEKIVLNISQISKCPCAELCEPNEGGLIIGIAIMKQFDGIENDFQQFTENLREKWNFGSCENNALIAIATEQQKEKGSPTSLVSLAVGNTNKIKWNQTLVEEIIEGEKNKFANQPFKGLKVFLNIYKQLIEKYNEQENKNLIETQNQKAQKDNVYLSSFYSDYFWYIYAFVLFIIVIFGYAAYSWKSKRSPVIVKDFLTRRNFKNSQDTNITTVQPIYTNIKKSEETQVKHTNLDDVPEQEMHYEDNFPHGTKV